MSKLISTAFNQHRLKCLFCFYFVSPSNAGIHIESGQNDNSLALSYRAHRLYTNGSYVIKDTNTKVYQSKGHALPNLWKRMQTETVLSIQAWAMNKTQKQPMHRPRQTNHPMRMKRIAMIVTTTTRSRNHSHGKILFAFFPLCVSNGPHNIFNICRHSMFYVFFFASAQLWSQENAAIAVPYIVALQQRLPSIDIATLR